MRKALTLAFVVLLGSYAFSQTNDFETVIAYPFPNPTTVDSVMTTTASDTVKTLTFTYDSLTVFTVNTIRADSGAARAQFTGVCVGMKLIRYGSPTIAVDTLYVLSMVGDTIITVSDTLPVGDLGNLKLQMPSAEFKNAVVGTPVMGTNIPNGTMVAAADSYYVVLSKRPTAIDGPTTNEIVFAQYKGSSTQYGTGELVGIPFVFKINYTPGLRLHGVEILDSAAQTANVDVVLYDAAAIAYSADNATYAPGGASFDNVVGYATVTTFKAIGANTSLGFVTDLEQPLRAPAGGWYYGVLLSRGTGTYAGDRSLILKLLFKR